MPEYATNKQTVAVDFNSSYAMSVCEELANFAINTTNSKFEGNDEPDLEMVKVVAATARRFAGERIMFNITFEAREGEGVDTAYFEASVLRGVDKSVQLVYLMELNSYSPPLLDTSCDMELGSQHPIVPSSPSKEPDENLTTKVLIDQLKESSSKFLKRNKTTLVLNGIMSQAKHTFYLEEFQRFQPARELVEVVAAKARIINSRVLFKVIFDAIDLCDGGLKSTYESFAYHGNGTNELVTLMRKQTMDTPDPLNPRPMTFEEELAYGDEVKSSDGFDVTATPGIYLFGMIQPVDLSIKGKKDECMEFVRFAIDAFNAQVKDSKGELLLDELFKAMHSGVNGILYYLTFSAINRDNGDKIICQAIVLWSPLRGDDVLCFRLKTSENEQDLHIGQWRRVWDKLECRRREIEGV